MRLSKLQSSRKPACYFNRCEVAHLQNPDFEPWLLAHRMLRSDVAGRTGLAARALVRAGWGGDHTILILTSMEVAEAKVVKDWQDQKRKESEAKTKRR